jgi:integrase
MPENNLRFETLSEEQEERLLMAGLNICAKMILFAINTGLRTSDIFNLRWMEVDIEQRRLKKIVKKNDKPLSLPLNETTFGIIEARLASSREPYVFYSHVSGDRFKDVKGALLAAGKRAGCRRLLGTCSAIRSHRGSRAIASTS